MKTYKITVGGVPYTVELPGRGKVRINGTENQLKDLPQRKALFALMEYDLPIPEGHVILLGGFHEGVVVDGINQKTGKPHTPLSDVPAWANTLVIIDGILLAIGLFVLMGGAIGGAVAGALFIVSVVQTARFSTATDKPMSVRVLLSLCVTLGICVAYFLIALLVITIFAAIRA